MLLKKIEIANLKKVVQAEIEFHGPGIQVIQGLNQSGKTTIAQAIAITINGPKDFNPGMVTNGKESAEIIAYTDDGLKIKTSIADGVKQDVYQLESGRYTKVSGGVRNFLNSLKSGLELPWSMNSMTDAQIIEILKLKTGIACRINEIDLKIQKLEQERTDCGRDKKRLGNPDPVTEIKHLSPIDDLLKERASASQWITDYYNLYRQSENCLRNAAVFNSLCDFDKYISSVHAKRREVEIYLEESKCIYDKTTLDSLDTKIADWHVTEQAADKYDAYLKDLEEIQKLDRRYKELTSEIEMLRTDRKKVLSSLSAGIKGLAINDDGLLVHNGVIRGVTDSNKPGNWSTAESVQVFFSLGAVFSGPLKMLIVDNAESLDENGCKAISEWAEHAGFLVILLKVGSIPEELDDAIIYLRNGEVLKK